jgi:hypothetical protein
MKNEEAASWLTALHASKYVKEIELRSPNVDL